MNFHEKENRLTVIREISRTSCCVIFVKRKKKETPMSEKTWRFREKNFRFRPALILLSPVREPNIRRKLLKERSHN